MNGNVVQKGPLTPLRMEHLVADRIVDGTDLHFAVDLESNRDRIHRVLMRVVRGAVERIDDPAKRGAVASNGSRLFGQDVMVGKRFANRRDDHRLAFLVRDGDQVPLSLESDVLFPRRMVTEDSSGPARSLHRKIGVIHDSMKTAGSVAAQRGNQRDVTLVFGQQCE